MSWFINPVAASQQQVLLQQPAETQIQGQLSALYAKKQDLTLRLENLTEQKSHVPHAPVIDGLFNAVSTELNSVNSQIAVLEGQLVKVKGESDDLGNDLGNTRMVGGTPYPTDRGDNKGNLAAWTYGVLNRCGVVFMDIPTLQGAIPFQHQDRMPFSPFTTDLTTPDNLALLALFLKGMSKDNFKAFTGLINDYMKHVSATIGFVADMGQTNWANGINSTMMISSMLHRLGMLDDQGLIRVQEHARSTFDKMITLEAAQAALAGVTSLVQGSRSTEKSSAEGGSYESAGGLAAILKMIK